MRLLARPAQVLLPEELRGNCAGLTVTIKTRIDRLREYLKVAKKEEDGSWATLFGDRPARNNATNERQRVEAQKAQHERSASAARREARVENLSPPGDIFPVFEGRWKCYFCHNRILVILVDEPSVPYPCAS